ncbi:DUF6415 family natural product biosynthesis protein [Streptomyces atratus]|uniref:DUF6415 family natural product biosynthesis protein n=1 Tax=Streptomyces atratus TaxID=1893 RepID=UPI003571638B
MTRYGSVVHAPEAILDAEIPLDREPHERLVETVLRWRADGTTPPQADLDQIALQLTGYARLLLENVNTACTDLSPSHPAPMFGRITCGEALRRLDYRQPPGSRLVLVQGPARQSPATRPSTARPGLRGRCRATVRGGRRPLQRRARCRRTAVSGGSGYRGSGGAAAVARAARCAG